MTRLLLLQTLSEGGIRALFRGMGAPLATVAVYNAVLFSARGSMERFLAHSDGAQPFASLAAIVMLKICTHNVVAFMSVGLPGSCSGDFALRDEKK